MIRFNHAMTGAVRSLLVTGAFIGVFGFLSSCSSPQTKYDSKTTDELPIETPIDLLSKFKITEEGEQPRPSPTEVAVTATKNHEQKNTATTDVKGKKSKVKKLDKTVTEKSNPPFVWPQRRPEHDAMVVGEKLTYEITYFGVPAGEVVLETLPYKTINGRKAYHLRGLAHSSAVFSIFYTLNDMIETFVDYEGLFSHRFHIVLDETKQKRDSLELNDSEKKQTFYWNRWDHWKKGKIEIKDYFPIPSFPQDSLSALLWVRNLPLEVNKSFTFPVVSEGKFWDGIVNVVRKEKLKTAIGEKEAFVIVPETKYQNYLKKQGDTFLWFADDEHKNLLRVEAKVKIGTITAVLKKAEYPNVAQ